MVIVLVIHWSSNCTAVRHSIHLYKEVPVTSVESAFTEFYQRLRKEEGRMYESLKQGNESRRRRKPKVAESEKQIKQQLSLEPKRGETRKGESVVWD